MFPHTAEQPASPLAYRGGICYQAAARPTPPHPHRVALTVPHTVSEILGPDGSIARRLPSYESRPQQLELGNAVAAAIAGRTHLLAEAGTGTGKSFAYLVPAILAAVAERKSGDERRRVVVSTQTISLQEQLVGRDLPFLRGVMPVEFSAVLAKGRGNYVSLRRLEGAVKKGAALFEADEHRFQLGRLADWAGETTDGSRSDPPLPPAPEGVGRGRAASMATAWAAAARPTPTASTTPPAVA